MSIFGLGNCKHEAVSAAEHVKSREITALTKQFKQICNTPINCFNTPKQFEKNLTALRAQVSSKLTIVNNNKPTHNSKKSGQLSKLSSDVDRVMKEKGFAYNKVEARPMSDTEKADAMQRDIQRKHDKAHGIDMGGMVR